MAARRVARKTQENDEQDINDDAVTESIESILVLLRGLGSTLVGSAPNAAEIQKLLDNLKDPR